MKVLKPLIIKIHLLEILILIVALKAPINTIYIVVTERRRDFRYPDIIDVF